MKVCRKKDLVKFAKEGWPDVTTIVNSVLRGINGTLLNMDKVSIRNFGEFKVVKTGVTHRYDFKTGKIVSIPRRYRVNFKASPIIERLINEKNKING